MGSPELTMAHPATLAFCALALIWSQLCQSLGTRETGFRTAHPENALAPPRSPPSSAARAPPCSSTTATPRTVRKARNVMPQPQMLPKEIPGDLLEERVMRGSDVFVEDKTVSKINLSTVVPSKS